MKKLQRGRLSAMLGSMGRGGDTLVGHINPQEAALLKALGGAGTVNPSTGLLEFRGTGPGSSHGSRSGASSRDTGVSDRGGSRGGYSRGGSTAGGYGRGVSGAESVGRAQAGRSSEGGQSSRSGGRSVAAQAAPSVAAAEAERRAAGLRTARAQIALQDDGLERVALGPTPGFDLADRLGVSQDVMQDGRALNDAGRQAFDAATQGASANAGYGGLETSAFSGMRGYRHTPTAMNQPGALTSRDLAAGIASATTGVGYKGRTGYGPGVDARQDQLSESYSRIADPSFGQSAVDFAADAIGLNHGFAPDGALGVNNRFNPLDGWGTRMALNAAAPGLGSGLGVLNDAAQGNYAGAITNAVGMAGPAGALMATGMRATDGLTGMSDRLRGPNMYRGLGGGMGGRTSLAAYAA